MALMDSGSRDQTATASSCRHLVTRITISTINSHLTTPKTTGAASIGHQSLTTATRVNSIASAAGPLIIDNYIFQNKLESFSPYFLTKDGGELTLGSLYASHQMLDRFAQPFIGQSLVDKVFAYSPVNKEFLDMDVRGLLKENGVIYDVKGILPRDIIDGRL